jgi:acyl carrier protein phosphodiesterase
MTPGTNAQLDLLCDPSARSILLKRWQRLMNDVLPNMADANLWPISQNHCFMRVCLDATLGTPWHKFVKRPASHHMTDHQLRTAIAVADQIVETPDLLPKLNRQSIEGRKLEQRRTKSGSFWRKASDIV